MKFTTFKILLFILPHSLLQASWLPVVVGDAQRQGWWNPVPPSTGFSKLPKKSFTGLGERQEDRKPGLGPSRTGFLA